MLKKLFFPLVALFMLAGCATPPTTIDVSPKITLPQQDPSLMGVTVSINGADQRQDQALAKVTRDNQQVTLTASRDLRFLLQEVLEKQMTARGYMIGPSGAVDLQIIVNNLYADVSQGNVRYNIATKADIAIIATAKNGKKMTKNCREQRADRHHRRYGAGHKHSRLHQAKRALIPLSGPVYHRVSFIKTCPAITYAFSSNRNQLSC